MLKNILIASILGSSLFSSISNSYISLTNIQDTAIWDEADLSKFQFKNSEGKDHSLSDWDSNDVSDNDFTLSFDKIINTDPITDSVQQQTFINLADELDNKLSSTEDSVFGMEKMFNYQATDDSFASKLNISILGQSSSSREKLNDPKNTFSEVYDMDIGQEDSFYLRISNKSSTDWSTNKSYFDVTLNIARYNIEETENLESDYTFDYNDGHSPQSKASIPWTNKPHLLFSWKKYASTWDEFVNAYNFVILDTSNKFDYKLNWRHYDAPALSVKISDIGRLNWSDPDKTNSFAIFSFEEKAGVVHQGYIRYQDVTFEMRLTYDTKYVYMDHKYEYTSDDSDQYAVYMSIDINNLKLSLYDI